MLAIRSRNIEMVIKDNNNSPIFQQYCLYQGQQKKKAKQTNKNAEINLSAICCVSRAFLQLYLLIDPDHKYQCWVLASISAW